MTLKRDVWRCPGGTWSAEVRRPGGMAVSVQGVSLRRAVWHVLTVRRPEAWAIRLNARSGS